MFAIQGNLCGERVRIGRALHKPPLTQEGLVEKIQLLGLEITKMIISRIERGERHVVDGELRVIAQALGVSMEWLVQDTDIPYRSN
jgi:transcriptional regulator with XRE-family HTH domain